MRGIQRKDALKAKAQTKLKVEAVTTNEFGHFVVNRAAMQVSVRLYKSPLWESSMVVVMKPVLMVYWWFAHGALDQPEPEPEPEPELESAVSPPKKEVAVVAHCPEAVCSAAERAILAGRDRLELYADCGCTNVLHKSCARRAFGGFKPDVVCGLDNPRVCLTPNCKGSVFHFSLRSDDGPVGPLWDGHSATEAATHRSRLERLTQLKQQPEPEPEPEPAESQMQEPVSKNACVSIDSCPEGVEACPDGARCKLSKDQNHCMSFWHPRSDLSTSDSVAHKDTRGSKPVAMASDEYGPPWDKRPPPGLDMVAASKWKKRQRNAKAAADRQAKEAAGGGKPKKVVLKMHTSHTAHREKPWLCNLCGFVNPVSTLKNSKSR